MTTDPIDSQLYGPLFTARAYAHIFCDAERLGAMLKVEAALAKAEAQCGVIPGDAAKEIAANCRAELFDMAALGEAAALSGNPVIPLIRALAELCGEAGRYVHWGATTQDIADSALVLQIRALLIRLEADSKSLVKALAELAERHRDTVMPARTFLQQALPTTFGCKAAAWLSPMLRHLERLDEIRPRLLVLQFGGAAGTLASLGDDGLKVGQALARELELELPDMPWHAGRDRFAELAGLAAMMAASCAKIAGDVVLMMQSEVGEAFEAAGENKGGSSTMPHKRNPVACTVIRAQAGQVQALLPVMLKAIEGEHERATGPWHGEWLALPQMLVLAGSALARTGELISGLEVDAKRMRSNVEAGQGLLMAEAAMMRLAALLGRQQAHGLLEKMSRQAVSEGRHLKQVLADNGDVAALLGDRELEDLFDPAGYTGQAGAFVDRVTARAGVVLNGKK